MDYAGIATSLIGKLFTAQGQTASGDAALQQGQETKTLDDYIAQQYRINAGQQMAAGESAAAGQDLQTQLTMSRALAVAAASGGGAKDPGVITQMSRLAGYGAYARQVDIYNGEEAARALNDKATASEYSGEVALAGGEQAKAASDLAVKGTAISGASSLFSKYASGGPSTSNAGGAGWTSGYDIGTGGALS